MKKQKGVVLILCLVVLLVITLLGVTTMQGSGLELKMVKDYSNRQQVFQATEAALRAVELQLLEASFPTAAQLDSAACAAADADTCFENTCAGGLCYLGDNSGLQNACIIYDNPAVPDTNPATLPPPDTPIWLDDTGYNIWAGSDNNFRGDFSPLNGSGIVVKYIIEFQCFVDSSTGTVLGNDGDAYYRVTALGEGASGLTKVMLQSTVSSPAP